MHTLETSTRDHAEILRSAKEASHVTVTAADPRQISRYLNPSEATIYPLEYAFHLLGDVRGKTVLDIGCGSGENLLPLIERGALVSGIDLSAELVALARQRVELYGRGSAQVLVASAYQTGFPDESFDVIFCSALLHHLEMPRICRELHRLLKPGGVLIVSEPIRFSALYKKLATLLPAGEEVSEYEYPLNREQIATLLAWFDPEKRRHFRLPLVALWQKLHWPGQHAATSLSARLIERFPALRKYATVAVMRLRK